MVSAEALTKLVEASQLTADLGGTLAYQHQDWLEMRVAVEDCLVKTHDLLDSYDDVKDQMEDLVTWLDDWQWQAGGSGGGGAADGRGLDYLKVFSMSTPSIAFGCIERVT